MNTTTARSNIVGVGDTVFFLAPGSIATWGFGTICAVNHAAGDVTVRHTSGKEYVRKLGRIRKGSPGDLVTTNSPVPTFAP